MNITTEDEKEIGRKVSQEIEKKSQLWENEIEMNRVNRIGNRLIQICERKDIEYNFRLLDESEVNAIALPGGIIYVFRGLLDMVYDDDELAAVLAHEMAHIERRHGITAYKKSMKAMFYNVLLLALTKNEYVALAADMISSALLEGFGREAELEADYYGLQFTIKASFNPVGMLTFFDELKRISMHYPDILKDYFTEHPPISERIKIIEDNLAKMNIDYKQGRGYKISKKLIPRKAFENNTDIGIITDGEEVIFSFANAGNNFSPYERAKAFCEKLNPILNENIKNYEIKLSANNENEWNLIVKSKTIEKITQEDGTFFNLTPYELANQWQENLRKYIWEEFIREGI